MSAPTPAQRSTTRVAWQSDDELLRCDVIRHSASLYEVMLMAAGAVVYRQIFATAQGATEEAERIQHLYLDPGPVRHADT